MTVSTTANPAAARGAESAAPSKAAALSAMLLGGAIIFVIGFSHLEVMHNAAHDTRHSAAFPCH